MKKVGILSSYPPNRDGIAPATKYHEEGLEKTDWEPVVLADSKKADYEIDRGSPFIWGRVRKLIREENLDLLHFHHTLTLYKLGGAFLPPIRNEVPVVGSFHELRHSWPQKPQYVRQRAAHLAENQLVKWTDASIVHTEKDRRKLERRFPDEEIREIPLGNPIRDCQPPRNINKLLVFGFIHSNKDIETAIRSMDLQDRELIVAGNPSDDYGSQEGQVEELRELAAGRENVELRLEWIPEGEKDELFRWSDAIVIPYLYGTGKATREAGDSGTLREAMSYNRPVITSKTQVFEETMQKFNVGETTDLEPESIREALDRTEEDLPEIRSELSRYRDENSWGSVARKYVGLYDELIE